MNNQEHQNPSDSTSSERIGPEIHASGRAGKHRRLFWLTVTLAGILLLALDVSAWSAPFGSTPQSDQASNEHDTANWDRNADGANGRNAEEEEDKNFGANDSKIDGEDNDENRKFSIDTVIAGGAQCQNLLGDTATLEEDFRAPDTCRGAVPLQLELSFRPVSSSELYAKLAFANNNSLNPVSPFALRTWAASLKDDIKDINGRGRDYLLEAWYKHRFTLQKDATLDVTGGFIDATNYLVK